MKTCLWGGGDGWPRCECASVCRREGRIDATPNRDMDYGNLAMHCQFVTAFVKKNKLQTLDQTDAFDLTADITFYLVMVHHRTSVAVNLIVFK